MNRDKTNTEITRLIVIIPILMGVCTFSVQAELPSEGSRLGSRILQSDLANMSLQEIRKQGRRIFSTPFNFRDGLGDGPLDPSEDPTLPGGRPTLQGSTGFALRMNGNDSQTCLECHSILSNASIPATFAVGGAGGVSASAFPGVFDPDLDDDGDDGSDSNDGIANMKGRMINPPFNFGSGGVEALAKEMTSELQVLLERANNNQGANVQLVTKGVSFGRIRFVDGVLDTSNINGIDHDLVVRPFGRKGCCFSVRDFDRGATQFHHGMQPVEVVGSDFDADGDGVVNEITIGEMSALHVFQVALERPRQKHRLNRQEKKGKSLFTRIGCAGCHIPKLTLNNPLLPLAFPEVPTDPSANVFMEIDLTGHVPGFKRQRHGRRNVIVALYADLKKHDMGPGLAESSELPDAEFFTTARLWGVADTAPYLHDGRAPTLSEAIMLHGGDAQGVRDNFDKLPLTGKEAVVAFLRTLHTPKKPSRDLR